MPGVNYSAPLAAASGQAANDWGRVSGGAQVSLSASAQLRRGVNLDLGVMGLANIEASLSKFLKAEVTGQAQAQATLRAQVQVPTNLFGEIGMAVRLEAIAELAAGVSASLGISIGDFIALVNRSPGMEGIPARLLLIFLDETSLQAEVFVKAALSAQAYAHIVIAGTAVPNPARNLKPGFNITAGLGAGLKAGAGFRVSANFGVGNFSKLVGRSVDALVDEAVDQAVGLVENDAALGAMLHGSRAPLKCSLRLAYELGDFIATSAPAPTNAGGEALAFRATQVVLEEAQRFLLRTMAEYGLVSLRTFMESFVGGAAWDSAIAERRALADFLESRPSSLFDGSADARRFWIDLAGKSIALASALGGAASTDFVHGAAIAWSAAQLSAIATDQVARLSGSASVIGLPPQQASASFTGPLPNQPPAALKQFIRARLQGLGAAPGSSLTQEDLLLFLSDGAVIGPVLAHVPGAREFLAPFASHLGQDAQAVARILLSNIGAIGSGSGAGASTASTVLDAMAGALREHLDALVSGPLSDSLRQTIGTRPDVRMIFDEVVIPSLRFVSHTAIDQVRRWSSGSVSKDALTEALSGVVLRIFGRSLVAVGDCLLAQAQLEMSRVMVDAAGAITAPNSMARVLSRMPVGGATFDEIAEVVGDALLVGAEVFGPLPDATRAVIRSSLYELIDLLPADADDAFINDLTSGDFVPNLDSITELATTLATVAIERFLLFVEKFLLRLAARVLDAIVEFITDAIDAVVGWIEDVVALIGQIAGRLIELVGEIAELVAEVADRFADAGAQLLDGIASLERQSVRNALVDGLADEFSNSVIALAKQTGVWDLVKHEQNLKSLFKSHTRSAFRAALRNQVVDQLLEAIGGAAGHLADLLDDLRAVDPDRELAPQIAEIVLDRIEEAVDEAFGDPVKVSVGFDIDIPFVGRRHVSLGRIELDIDPMLDVVRAVARGAGAFQSTIADAAANLAAAFGAEQTLGTRRREHSDLTKEHDRLKRHQESASPTARGLEIASPVVAQMIDHPSSIEILIRGADPIMVEAEAGVPERVHILLNDVAMPLQDFVVESSNGSQGRGGESVAGLAHGIDLAASSRSAGAVAFEREGVVPAVTVSAFGVARSAVRASGPLSSRTLAGTANIMPPSARPNRGRSAGSARLANLGPRLGEERRGNPTSGVSIGPPGGFATRGLGVQAPLLPLPNMPEPLLRLRRSLLPGMLVDGINTLAVVVVWPNGESIQKAVTFFAAPAASEVPASAGGKPGRKPGGRPAAVPGSKGSKTKQPPGRDGKEVVIAGHRAHLQGLLVPAQRGAVTMPRASMPSRKDLVPGRPHGAKWQLPLAPRATRKVAIRSLLTSVSKAKTRVDVAATVRSASPVLASRLGKGKRGLARVASTSPAATFPRTTFEVLEAPKAEVAPRPVAESPFAIAVRTPPRKRKQKKSPSKRRGGSAAASSAASATKARRAPGVRR